eukprot:TRINITY_DN6798_c0_g1_i1.p1 TRINITY_DN6798_c0_g1~~TRINITY_DN6798_c0_g1_i1.p1  ORF type:complete len:397 (+),score=91.73 TRINITY_DN6798_c0_g1_i1:109-1299(+)
MVRLRPLRPLPLFDHVKLSEALVAAGVKTLHVQNILSHVSSNFESQEGSDDWYSVPGLPHAAMEVLREKFAPLTSRLQSRRDSSNGSTTKLLLELQDGLRVECVIMRHDASAGVYAGQQRPGGPRATLCISSQVGCQMGCKFCATGSMGLQGDMAAGEIVEQLLHAQRVCPIRNIVFMGMGEPLNNYYAVCQAVRAFTLPPFNLSPNHITVSTVGVVPRILSMADDMPGINLALSLHAPNQELRTEIVPSAKAFRIDKLMGAVERYLQKSTGKRVFVEYVMLAGVNDSVGHAEELGQLLRGCSSSVVLNLIPYNATSVADAFTSPTAATVGQFQSIMREKFSVRTTVRKEMGADIAGACGQLALHQPSGPVKGWVQTSAAVGERDIEDLAELKILV